MRKQEFLNILSRRITGQLSPMEVKDHIQYYDDYISGEVNKGKTEEEVIQEIGGPHLVAKTLINAKDMTGQTNSRDTYRTSSQDVYENVYGQTKEGTGKRKGFSINHDHDGWDIRYGKVKLNTWYFKIILTILAILLLVGILSAVGLVLRVLIPIVVPIVIIFFILNLVSNRRYK